MKKFIFIFLFLFSGFLRAQTLTLFAGNGTVLGDGGPATSAGIADPIKGVFDKIGNYYVASGAGGNRIRKIDTTGVISTVAGNGATGASGDNIIATAAAITAPASLTLDSSGNLFIVDAQSARIRKVSKATGIITTIAGTGIGGFNGDGIQATSAEIYGPQDICFDKFGNLFITDLYNYRVRKIDNMGIISTFAGTGTPGYSGEGGLADTSKVDVPSGICADSNGNIYIADASNFRVFKVNTAGIMTTYAGTGMSLFNGDNIPATNANIEPVFISVDVSGNLFIADHINRRVRKVSSAGIITTVAGTGVSGSSGTGGPATAAEFIWPNGVAIDACGNLYIPDGNINNIRKVNFNPTCDPYSHGHIDSASLQTKEPVGGKIAIYPNPAYSSLTISSTQKIKQVIIANFMGEAVYAGVYDIEKAEVNIAGLPEGVFVVRVTDDKGSVTMSKIVKQ